MLRKIWMLLFLSANNMAVAADNFDISTNVLTAPQVRVADTLYFDVQLKVTSVVSVGNSVVAETYDTYNAQNNQLSIPVVTVGSATYYNAIVTVGTLLKSVLGKHTTFQARIFIKTLVSTLATRTTNPP
jgi:hypothetical protein